MNTNPDVLVEESVDQATIDEILLMIEGSSRKAASDAHLRLTEKVKLYNRLCQIHGFEAFVYDPDVLDCSQLHFKESFDEDGLLTRTHTIRALLKRPSRDTYQCFRPNRFK